MSTEFSTITDLNTVRSLADGLRLGTLRAIDEHGRGLVHLGAPDAAQLLAPATFGLRMEHVGREVVVANAGSRPVILGVLHGDAAPERESAFAVELDGETLHLRARHKVVISCGEASVVLQSDGKVMVKGTEVLSRAAGSNKIRGGNVQIN